MKERIKFIIDQNLMTPNSFAKKIGVSSDTMYNILSKPGYNVSSATIKLILDAFKNVSKDWLVDGKGEPFTTKQNPLNTEEEVQEDLVQYGANLKKKIQDLQYIIQQQQTIIDNQSQLIDQLTMFKNIKKD